MSSQHNPNTAASSYRISYVGSVDQGTTSTRFILFDNKGNAIHAHQIEHKQIHPQEGWTEHDPMEIYSNSVTCIDECVKAAGIQAADVKAIGITNQRETTVAWDKHTGKPLHNAIVWHDLRTAQIVEKMSADGGQDKYRTKTGLPLSTYFAGVKMRWLIENVAAVREAVDENRCRFGTIDTWLLYNLSGGVNGDGAFVTDIDLCEDFGVPMSSLAEIRSNSEIYSHVKGGTALDGVPISCTMGDQQAATLGQGCISTGQIKNTYGTGCFIFMNTGEKLVPSEAQLLSTVLYRLGPQSPLIYGLEGAIAGTGASVQWLRDGLKIIDEAKDMDRLASQVEDAGGVVVVPAFSGLLAPHWRPDARGAILGMTFFTTRAHVARALLDGVALLTADVVDAMEKDLASHPDIAKSVTAGTAGQRIINDMRVDGGMTKSEILCQTQANYLGFPIQRANMAEGTAFGSAFAAGLAVGFWDSVESIPSIIEAIGRKTFRPIMGDDDRKSKRRQWSDAVQRSFGMDN